MFGATRRISLAGNYPLDSIIRQTPDCSGKWGDCSFKLRDGSADLSVVLNKAPVDVVCPRPRWLIVQEPPDGQAQEWYTSRSFDRIYTCTEMQGSDIHLSHGALPWHVNKTYDYLKTCGVPEKRRKISWITSNKAWWPGHQARLLFLKEIQSRVSFDLFGHGYVDLDDKWDGLAPYEYSFAIENFSGGHYWTEKIADCFLAWTMPIYYGSPLILDYFPAEAMLVVDIADPAAARESIEQAIAGERFGKNIDAIAHARQLVLDCYQIFPFLRNAINAALPIR